MTTNLAQDVVSMINRKPSAQSRKAGAKVNVVDIVSEEKRLDLSSRETWAVKRHTAILNTQDKHLRDLVEIGKVILDVRSLYKSDNEFKQAVEDRPIGKIAYSGSYGRYILMQLADLWSELEPKLGTDGYTSKSPETLVKKLKAEKRENGEATAKRGNKGKSKTSRKKSPLKNGVTKAQLLQMIQLGLDNGVITEADIKSLKPTKK